MSKGGALMESEAQTKFCKYCGTKIPIDAVICSSCGRQVEELKHSSNEPSVVINNTNTNANVNANVNAGVGFGRWRNKWVAIILCLLLGVLGAHKFYEGKAIMGILYFFTGGLFLVGVIVDFLALLVKPNPYLVV
ncbi:MAG: TM2 domain-containing protein [Clostridia bacterium]|nr:TM2 domain-containing protein [Clostridia bacterium]